MKKLYLSTLETDRLRSKGRLFGDLRAARSYIKAAGSPEGYQVVRVYHGYFRSLFMGYSVMV